MSSSPRDAQNDSNEGNDSDNSDYSRPTNLPTAQFSRLRVNSDADVDEDTVTHYNYSVLHYGFRRPSLEADGVTLGQILADRATNVNEYTLSRTTAAARSEGFQGDEMDGVLSNSDSNSDFLSSSLYAANSPKKADGNSDAQTNTMATTGTPTPTQACNIPGGGGGDHIERSSSLPVTHDELQEASGGMGAAEAPVPQAWSPNDAMAPALYGSSPSGPTAMNPTPQPAIPLSSTEDGGGMLGRRHVIIMVGLPARGKSLIGKRLAKYLSFFHGARCRIFNAGVYRRQYKDMARQSADFYDPENEDATRLRDECAQMCLEDIGKFLLEEDKPYFSNSKTVMPGLERKHSSTRISGTDDTDRAVDSGRVAIFDATNTTRKRRQMIKDFFAHLEDTHTGPSGRPSFGSRPFGSLVKLVWIESVITDEQQIVANILSGKVSNDDYSGEDTQAVLKDFRERCRHYEKVYEPLGSPLTSKLKDSMQAFLGPKHHVHEEVVEGEQDDSWVRTVNGGKKLVMNNIHGFLPGRIVQFLANLHLQPHTVYMSRHGQSEYNKIGRIGGDSDITKDGQEYAKALGKYTFEVIQGNSEGLGKPVKCRLWTSSLRRTVQTARYIPRPVLHDKDGSTWKQMDGRRMHGLDEIFAGICDGMTYQEISERYPDEFVLRKENKLSYRYPRGESYLDVISRLDPLVQEIESYREPLLIVGHQGVLRLIYAYLVGRPREEAPSLSIPLNTVIKLDLLTEGVRETRTELLTVDQHDGQRDPATTSSNVFSPTFESIPYPGDLADPLNPPSH